MIHFRITFLLFNTLHFHQNQRNQPVEFIKKDLILENKMGNILGRDIIKRNSMVLP